MAFLHGCPSQVQGGQLVEHLVFPYKAGQAGHLHMARLMSHHKRRGEAILMVQGAAADGVAHPSDGSIAWEETEGGSSRQA